MLEFKNLDVFFESNNIFFLRDYDLKTNSYSKTGGSVKRLLLPKNEMEMLLIIKKLKEVNLEYTVIGEMTNIFFLDSVEYSIFISTKFLDEIHFNTGSVIVSTGRNLPDFVRLMASKDIEGFEGLEGIPGSIGGALVMNAGAYGYCISDKLIKLKAISKDGKIVELLPNDLSFARRKSIFQNKELYITEAEFKTKVGDRCNISSKIESYHIARHSYQEWVYPNLGSIFSCNKSIYDNIKWKDKWQEFQFKIYRKVLFNKLTRFYRRKKPSNELLNQFIFKRFTFDGLDASYSRKNLNTFINCNMSTNEILSSMALLKKITNQDVFLENELVFNSLYNIEDENSYKKSIELYKKTTNEK